MATTPENEEPGAEADVNELPEDQDNASEDTLEDDPLLEDESGGEDIEEVQEEAAKERKEGGYQW